MNVYRLSSVVGLGFGYFLADYARLYRSVAPRCGLPCDWGDRLERVYPAELQFQGGNVCDFMTAIDFTVTRIAVAEELSQRFRGITLEPVTIAPAKRGVAAKYTGPELVELRLDLSVPVNPDRSTLEITDFCPKCCRHSLKILGIEEPPHEEKIGDRWEMVERRPRKPGMGLIIPRSKVEDCDFFEYDDCFVMCNQLAKDYIVERKWTNAEFVEYDEIVSD